MHLGGGAVEGVGHHQEGVGPHGEKLPVVGAGGGDGLVGFEQARPRVPLVNDAVDVVVVSWKPSSCVREVTRVAVASRTPDPAPGPQPGLGPLWTPPCSPPTLLRPLTAQQRRPSRVHTACVCPNTFGGSLFGWLRTLTMAFQGLGGGPPLPRPSLTCYSVPLAPTLPQARRHAPRRPSGPAAPGTLTSMGSGLRGSPCPSAGGGGSSLGPPQSSLACLGLR